MGPFAEILRAVAETPAPSQTPITDLLVVGLGSAGLGAILAAIINGFFSKKKLGAEATEIITKAASGVVENMQKDLDRQVEAREADAREHKVQMERAAADQAAMAAAHVAEREEWRRVLQLHVAWDTIAIAKLNELGVNMPPAPPMLPAQRHVDDKGYPV